MDPTVLIAIIGCMQAIVVALIGGLFSYQNKKTDDYRNQRDVKKKEEAEHLKERDKQRMERDTALYDLMFSVAGGTEVLLHKAHGDNLNGNVDDALKSIKEAKAECNKVFNRHVAQI